MGFIGRVGVRRGRVAEESGASDLSQKTGSLHRDGLATCLTLCSFSNLLCIRSISAKDDQVGQEARQLIRCRWLDQVQIEPGLGGSPARFVVAQCRESNDREVLCPRLS